MQVVAFRVLVKQGFQAAVGQPRIDKLAPTAHQGANGAQGIGHQGIGRHHGADADLTFDDQQRRHREHQRLLRVLHKLHRRLQAMRGFVNRARLGQLALIAVQPDAT